MVKTIRQWSGGPHGTARVLAETPGEGFRTEQIAIEAEPGLEISGTLYVPNAAGRKPAAVLIDLGPQFAAHMARKGTVVLDLRPRGVPEPPSRQFSGNWMANTRAWVVGKNLVGMRVADIRRGVDVLAARADVDTAAIRGAARGIPGVWLLMAAATDGRLARVWVDRTPYSIRAALEAPLHRNLHDAVIPGFALSWDFADVVKAIGPAKVIWSDPTDWLGTVVPHVSGAVYRTFAQGDEPYLAQLAAQ